MPKRRRPGRNRLPGPRTASGRHIPARDATDLGSELLQAQRAALVKREDGSTGDPTMAAYPLGALLASGAISQEQHDAGVKYAKMYLLVAPRPAPTAMDLAGGKSGRIPDDDTERAEQRKRDEAMWRQAGDLLRRMGSRTKDAVDNTAAHTRWPRWMVSDIVRQSDVREALALVAGLDALAVAFGLRRDRRAA